jgi:nitrous oxide reductase accessory protein NosL
MKKLILLALLTTALVSCKKEEVKPTPAPAPTENEACKCGVIQDLYHLGGGKWKIWVQNNCSANVKSFDVNWHYEEGTIHCADKSW